MIEGRLVRLRANEPEDAERYVRWLNDPEVTQGLAARYPMSMANELAFIENARNPSYANLLLAIETREGRHIGGMGLHDAEVENRVAEIGIAIGDKSVWGQGYGTDAMVTLCRFGFAEMGLHKIRLVVHAINPRAQRVYERIGFRVEAVAREAWYEHGRYVDLVHMGLLDGELVDVA